MTLEEIMRDFEFEILGSPQNTSKLKKNLISKLKKNHPIHAALKNFETTRLS